MGNTPPSPIFNYKLLINLRELKTWKYYTQTAYIFDINESEFNNLFVKALVPEEHIEPVMKFIHSRVKDFIQHINVHNVKKSEYVELIYVPLHILFVVLLPLEPELLQLKEEQAKKDALDKKLPSELINMVCSF